MFLALTAVSLAGCGPSPRISAGPSAGTTTTTPASTNPSVATVGSEETVYDWSTDRCADDMLPDLPVRAFRDARGMIQLNVSHTRNFRLIGPDFNSLTPSCQVTLASAVDPDPSHYRFKEWVGATYTLDGRTVYALIHNEWYGDQASRWNAVRDFSNRSGGGNWYYQGWTGSGYQNLSFDSGKGVWRKPGTLCQIGSTWVHPDLGCDVTRTWISPVTATVTVSGSVKDGDAGGGNGVSVTILNGTRTLWSATLNNGDSTGKTFNLPVSVRPGDQLHFRVNARGDSGWDTTVFNPVIDIGPPPCPSGVHNDCLMMSVTSAVSTDGGATFTRPSPSQSLVASLPYRWTPDAGQIAMWQPSNIVKSPRDGFYYSLVQVDYRRRGQSGFEGMCLIRTKTLNDPGSWRAWDGNGFGLRLANPYLENVDSPQRQTCTAVSHDTVGALSYSLTYNSYFDQFVAVGHDIFRNPPGFYYSLSSDLVHWTPKKLLMAADLVQTTNGRTPYLAYPSLIDHDSSARNFDVTGQSPYLYFTRVNSTDPLNFDLLRVRIRFEK